MAKPKAKKSIKRPSATQGLVVKSNEPTDYNKRPPVFSLEKLQPGDFCFSKLNKDHKSQFAEAIYRRKSLTWNEINCADRHALGYEKIPKDQIKQAMPLFITEDEDHLLVFRYNGMHPMVGYRKKDVFYILWFDHNFKLYNH